MYSIWNFYFNIIFWCDFPPVCYYSSLLSWVVILFEWCVNEFVTVNLKKVDNLYTCLTFHTIYKLLRIMDYWRRFPLVCSTQVVGHVTVLPDRCSASVPQLGRTLVQGSLHHQSRTPERHAVLVQHACQHHHQCVSTHNKWKLSLRQL